jgi:transcriptional regulator with XRE-family HTH domain
MTSPFVRRWRLAAELRALREERGMTADRLACLIHQSRMKISKLENAHIRPDLAEIMKILDVLDVTGEKWHEIIRIARDAAERGWWDAYGDAMGDRQRLYADIEPGATTIREYQPGAMPGILQTPDYTWALIEHAKAEGPITYIPERLVEARLQRQRTVRIFPLVTGMVAAFMPKSPIMIFTFPDESEPPMAVASTVFTDLVHTESEKGTGCVGRYDYVRNEALSEVTNLAFLNDLADQIINTLGIRSWP